MKEIVIDASFGSLMVIVPHPDDEILLCAGILRRAAAAGLKVTVVMVTNGDYEDIDRSIGKARLSETIKGVECLGIREEQVELLGYADTGVEKDSSFLYRMYESKDEEKTAPSQCSGVTYGLDTHEDFHCKIHGSHAEYCRKNLTEDIAEVIGRYEPDSLFTTSEFDIHCDHAGLYLLVREALKDRKSKGKKVPRLFSGIVHSLAGDEIWPVREQEIVPLTCPPDFERTSSLRWDDRVSFPVPPEMMAENRENNLKYQSLSRHVTALKPDVAEYLYSFVKAEELFWEINGES